MIRNTYDCVLIYLFSPVQYGCFLSKDSVMRASTQDISTLLPFIFYLLFIIVIILVDI